MSADEGPLRELLKTLDLEEIDRDLFRGRAAPTRLQRVFGGQVAGQALVAAQRTVPDRLVHSLHAYFLRPGAPDVPIVFEVDRIRDGRSYATRRVVGIQNGKAIFNLQASFHQVEEGLDHQISAPPSAMARDPESLPLLRRFFDEDEPADPRPAPSEPFEMRVAPPADGYHRLLWLRTLGTVPDDPMLHRFIAAYASDLTLVSVAVSRDQETGPRPSFVASLDHAMWFQRPFRVDEWFLYAQMSPSAHGGRGLAEGQLFTPDGTLAVTVMQEGAIRP